MKRAAVIVNKEFEYRGFIEGLRDNVTVHAGTNGRDAEIRMDNVLADVYCIQHLFGEGENSSNSEVKFDYLRQLLGSHQFRLEEMDYIFSVSTSETTPEVQKRHESRNGCVYVGNNFFISDQRNADPTTCSHLAIGTPGSGNSEIYRSPHISSQLYYLLSSSEMRMREPRFSPAYDVRCFADSGFICLGVANVMNYSCYKDADRLAHSEYVNKEYCHDYVPVGLETTHGIVAKAVDYECGFLHMPDVVPVTFVSPIVDRYLRFDDDVDGTGGLQNFVCSYNGGVVVGNALSFMSELYRAGRLIP